MMMAAVKAIADLAKEDVPDAVLQAYPDKSGYRFGRDYLIPKPVDPRVLMKVAPAVAKAAMESGVARKPVDMNDYLNRVELLLGPTKKLIRSLRNEISAFCIKKGKLPLVVVANGHDPRALRAAAQAADGGDVRICLLGSRSGMKQMSEKLGLHGLDKKVMFRNPLNDEATESYAKRLYQLRNRSGVSLTTAHQRALNHNYFAALMLEQGEADGLVCGLSEHYSDAVRPILQVIGVEEGQTLAGIYLVVANRKLYFFADCTINSHPDVEELAEIAITTSDLAKRYTDDSIRVAMLSYSSFGSSKADESKRVRHATSLVQKARPDLVIDGEMQVDVALNQALQQREFPFCKLEGEANVLIFPNLDAANISYKLLSHFSEAVPTGPILVGMKKPANVMQISASVEEIVNMIFVTAHQAVQK